MNIALVIERTCQGSPSARSGRTIGLAIAAVLDLILDVARDRGAARLGRAPRCGRTALPGRVSWGKS